MFGSFVLCPARGFRRTNCKKVKYQNLFRISDVCHLCDFCCQDLSQFNEHLVHEHFHDHLYVRHGSLRHDYKIAHERAEADASGM